MVEKILFLVFAALAVAGGLGTITRKNVIHALLLLVFTFVNIAAIFLLTGAYFLAVVQILVYAGAIMVLFVFVIMLLGAEQIGTRHLQRWFLPLAIFLGSVLLIETVYIVLSQRDLLTGAGKIAEQFGSPKVIGELLFNQYLLPFEATSILLLTAMIGAIVLTKRVSNTHGVSNTQTEKK
jgi:NADH-quinone oxidoreductase subunit J